MSSSFSLPHRLPHGGLAFAIAALGAGLLPLLTSHPASAQQPKPGSAANPPDGIPAPGNDSKSAQGDGAPDATASQRTSKEVAQRATTAPKTGEQPKGTKNGASTPEATPGACVANFMAAQEQRARGQWLRASESLRQCGQRRCSDVVRVKCVEWLSELTRKMPSIVVNAKDQMGNDLSAVSLTIDGQAVPIKKARLGLELDPGEHKLELRHKGRMRGVRIALTAGEKNRAVRVTFPGVLQPGVQGTTVALEGDPNPWRPKQVAALIGLSSAAVAIGIGSVTGVLALNRFSDVAAACEFRTCNPPDFPVYDGGLALAHASTVSFSLGAAALVGGVTLLLVDRANQKSGTGKETTRTGLRFGGPRGAIAGWAF